MVGDKSGKSFGCDVVVAVVDADEDDIMCKSVTLNDNGFHKLRSCRATLMAVFTLENAAMGTTGR